MASAESVTFRERVGKVSLPSEVRSLVQEYERRIGIRDDFVWRWMYELLPSFRLSCVPDRHGPTVRSTKTLLTIFITVLDDIAEHEQDQATFEQARNIPLPDQSTKIDHPSVDSESLEFAARVWGVIEERLEVAPRYDEFVDPLYFDLRRTFAAMDHSRLLANQPDLANLPEAYACDAHNMVMFPYANIDLMHSPEFDRSDLGSLRATILDLQCLARIGNWVTTWEREVHEGDYSSGVVIDGIESDVIDREELKRESSGTLVERLECAGIEDQFYVEWSKRFDLLEEELATAESVDLEALLSGMEEVFEFHLQSRGLK